MSSERGQTTSGVRATLVAATLVACVAGCDEGSGASGVTGFGPAGFGSIPGGFVAGAGGFPATPPPLGGQGSGGATPVAPAFDAGSGPPVADACATRPAGCEVLVATLAVAQPPCLLALEGLRVTRPADACRGELRIDARRVACGGADGWQLTADGRHVLLLGGACAELAPEASAVAAFPCDIACPEPTATPDADAGTDPPTDTDDDAGVGS